MDFFFVEDIGRIIDAILLIHTPTSRHDINLCYPERMLYLSDIAKFINTLGDHEVPIEIQSENLDTDYFGNPTMLVNLIKNMEDLQLSLELTGLKEGIRRMYEQL